jgi:hypothetical protein
MFLLGLYILLGSLFAVVFVFRIAPRLDPAARDGSWGFRLILVPASVALWPALLWISIRRLQ